jgi:hypothetical protein
LVFFGFRVDLIRQQTISGRTTMLIGAQSG